MSVNLTMPSFPPDTIFVRESTRGKKKSWDQSCRLVELDGRNIESVRRTGNNGSASADINLVYIESRGCCLSLLRHKQRLTVLTHSEDISHAGICIQCCRFTKALTKLQSVDAFSWVAD